MLTMHPRTSQNLSDRSHKEGKSDEEAKTNSNPHLIELQTQISPPGILERAPPSDPFEWAADIDSKRIDEQHNRLLDKVRNQQTFEVPTELLVKGQPVFHQDNKKFMEKFCKCCLSENRDLMKSEVEMYYRFREELIQPYDEFNHIHEAALLELYRKAIGIDFEEGLPERLITEKWQNIGFQGRNPRTDFRGGGILGLQCLIYFITNYHQEFQEMITQSEDNFFFAISGINVTHMLIVYFYLNKSDVPPDSIKLRAGRVQTKNFCQMNSLSKSTFYEIHSFALQILFKMWKDEYHKTKPMPPNFNLIVAEAKKLVNELLTNQRCKRIQDFRQLAQVMLQTKYGSGGQKIKAK
ncbi:hypothetical protein FGO68_gene4949 [Halteria grandinella]|uniref:ELMO domain-containing protein n=1 Tax=Halteria grandinella TaxID=5974 RepID=A0A8J8SX29_HALGN|nr:hypothetical protein FGO68_gene4949 [Halteria grandinella]